MNVAIERYTLGKLRTLFAQRILAVPEIQREFVWNPRKVCMLLDSLFRGYPVGTALIWKTASRNRNDLRERLHLLPHFDPTNREIWFIVDGQQRLSVLYHVLCRDELDREAGRQVPFDFDRIFFFAGPPAEDTENFVYRRGHAPDGYVALASVLRGGKALSDLAVRPRRRASECRDRLLAAPFFLQVMEADDLRDVRETFIRINAQGTPVSSADRAFARASSMGVRHLVRNVIHKLPLGFRTVPSEVVLSALTFSLGEEDVGGRAWERLVKRVDAEISPRSEFSKKWREVEEALPYAVDYLSRYGVTAMSLLPSTQLLVLLTLYFVHRGKKRPPSAAAKRLDAWFWHAAVSDRYSGRGYRQNLLDDARFMARLAESPNAKQAPRSPVDLYRLRRSEYAAGSSLSRAYFALLALQQPRYLEDGGLVPGHAYASVANRPDKHHIFPRQHLVHHGFTSRDFNAIPNVCLIVARENQRIGAKAPRAYLQIGAISHSKRARSAAFKSHLIPGDADSGLWDENARAGFESFVEQRTEKIANAFEKRAGVTLFRR